MIVLFALGAVSVLSLVGLAGKAGEWIAYVIALFFGWGTFLFPMVLFGLGYVSMYPSRYQLSHLHYIGLVLLVLSFLGFLHLFIPYRDLVNVIPEGRGGGYFGLVLAFPLYKLLGLWASGIILVALVLVSLLLVFNISISAVWQRLQGVGSVFDRARNKLEDWTETEDGGAGGEDGEAGDSDEGEVDGEAPEHGEPSRLLRKDIPGVQTEMPLPPRRIRRKIDIPLKLLSDASERPQSGDIQANKERIQKTLENFGIAVTMHDVSVGPTVTQYSLKPADGVKLAHITGLQRDLALALAAHPIRIEAPIPGKSLVGIEVPNKTAALVRLKELLRSPAFKKRKSALSLALGKDVAGESYVADLDTMPHMLVAGATGSGKSVCINTIILSLIFQNNPSDLKLILVDPKRVELTMYNGIPYLLTPVITNPEKTINALKWAVAEMDRRYELLSQSHRRNIGAYNEKIAPEERMPYIVIIVDELADLMSVAAQEMEGIIIRLAQMARAVGIHLILATQRPSVDVLTGLIKANITSRIAFNVASLVDSRTILDFQGAEKLLGKGDMLFISADLSKPKRLQGAFVDEEEILNVVNFLKENAGDPDYDAEIVNRQQRAVIPGVYQDDENDDELLDEAKEVIMRAGKASASLLQRRLRVGYARAARILDILEEQGVIGPADGARPREVLVTADEMAASGDRGGEDDGGDVSGGGVDDKPDEEDAFEAAEDGAEEDGADDGAEETVGQSKH